MTEQHPFSRRAATNQAHLRIMGTTDVHVALLPYDYYADAPNDTVGLTRTATLIAHARAEATNTLLVDNGDLLQGNPMGDYFALGNGLRPGHLHPVVKAMNALGYDAATVGNHEFNYGLDFLFRALHGADFPIVCANLTRGELADDPRDDVLHFAPYALLDRQIIDGAGGERPIRIGLIGLLPPQVMMWDAKNLQGHAQVRGIVETARLRVPQMRAAGADVVIALSHSGIAAGEEPDKENASLHLATVEGIDAIVTGHQHLVFPGAADLKGISGADADAGTLYAKPAMMAGFFGSHLGVIDLMVAYADGGWHVIESTCETRPIFMREGTAIRPLAESDPAVEAAVMADHEATLAYIRTPVGHSAVPLQSYFSLVADCPSVQIVADVQTAFARDRLKNGPYRNLPILSAAAPFKCGGRGGVDYYTDVPAGAIAIKNIADLYLYPNTFRAMLVTGAELKDWLEMSAGLYCRVAPGAHDAVLISESFSAYNFDIIDGVTYEIDITEAARFDSDGRLVDASANRIRNLCRDGVPVEPDQRFIVATNNYRAGGGGNFPGLTSDKVVLETTEPNRDLVVHYVIDKGTIDPRADGNWRLVAPPGTMAVFESSPKGARFLPDVPNAHVEPAGPGSDGFARYRISW